MKHSISWLPLKDYGVPYLAPSWRWFAPTAAEEEAWSPPMPVAVPPVPPVCPPRPRRTLAASTRGGSSRPTEAEAEGWSPTGEEEGSPPTTGPLRYYVISPPQKPVLDYFEYLGLLIPFWRLHSPSRPSPLWRLRLSPFGRRGSLAPLWRLGLLPGGGLLGGLPIRGLLQKKISDQGREASFIRTSSPSSRPILVPCGEKRNRFFFDM